MKKVNVILYIVFVSALFLQSYFLIAQVPQKVSYQSVIRNTSGELVKSATVGIKISILQGSVSGTVTYAETHSVVTNVNGLATLSVGMGTPVTGTFSVIDWSNSPYFLKVETDPAGGTSYIETGTSEILSVPYALHAKTADSITNPQWTTSGSNLYYNNGNVGIGLTNPTKKLEVAGIIASSNNISTSYVQSFGYGNDWDYSGFLLGDFTTGNHWGIKHRERGVELNNLAIDWFNGSTFTTMFSIKTNGNVGIGLMNPSKKLEVAGTIASSDTVGTAYVQSFGLGNNWDYSGLLVGDLTTGRHWGIKHRERDVELNNLAIDWFNGSTFTTMFSIKTNGNVGIGLMNPTNKLDVAGNITSSDSVGSSYISSFGVGDTHNFSHLQLGDKTTSKYWQFVHKQEVGELNNLDLDWFDGSTWHPLVGIKTNGNVGIGTVNPTNKLDVAGGIGAENIWSNNSSGPSFLTCFGIGDDWIFSSLILGDKSTTKSWSLQHRKIASELNNFSIEYFDSSANTPVFSIKPNGNVGIGTVNPINKLDVAGNIASIDTVGSSYLSSFGVGDTQNFSHLQLGDKTTGKYWQFVHKQNPSELNNLDLDWWDGSTWHPLIGIKTNGNVGIGTLNPTNKLEVAGDMKVFNNSTISNIVNSGFGDDYNFSGLSLSNTTGNIWSIRHKKYSSQLNYFVLEYESNSNWYQMLAIKPNGSMGIGTQEPKSKLQVTGGDIYIEDIGSGVIMKSPNGNCWRITIDNSGNLIRTAITCP